MKRFITIIFSVILIFSLSACGVTVNAPSLTEEPNLDDVLLDGQLARLTTEQKIGQLFCVSFSGAELDESVKKFFKEYYIGNVILFSKNIENAEQTAALCRGIQSEITADTGVPAFIGTDQEGGTVVRVTDGAVYYPGAMAVSAAGSAEYARKVGENMGSELKSLGINVDFAPVADVNSNPDNPVIGVRSYGDSPDTVGAMAEAFAEGMASASEICTAKHYPGHGDTDADSHYGLPMVDKSLDEIRQSELLPFKRLVTKDIPAVMAAHIIYPQIDSEYPASMSKILLTDVLRGELGFEGMVVTDGLRMGAVADGIGTPEACVAAVNAGADLLLTGSGGETEDLSLEPQIKCVERVREAVKNGEITKETLDSAVLRILKCKQEHGAGKSAFEPLDNQTLKEHRALASEISRKSITLIRDKNGLLPVRSSEKVLVISSDRVKRLDEGSAKAAVTMAEYMAEKLGGGAEFITGKLTEGETKTLAKKAAGYDKVIIGTNRISHAELVNAVTAQNPNTITVSLDNPYILRKLTDCGTFLCAYEYTSDSVESAAAVISGEAEAQGRLPVELE